MPHNRILSSVLMTGVVFVAALPVLAAVDVTVNVSNAGLAPSGGATRDYWTTTAVGGYKQGDQVLTVSTGTAYDVNWMGSSPVGTFTVNDLTGGFYTVATTGSAMTGSVNTTTPTVYMVSQPVTFNMKNYASGWNLCGSGGGIQFTWQDSGSETYNLPKAVQGTLYTPVGSTTFSLAANGNVTVLSSTGQSMTGGFRTLSLNGLFPATFNWQQNGVNTNVAWWAGDGPSGGGGNKGGNGTGGYMSGSYAIGWTSLPAGSWAGGLNTFTIPTTPADYWSQTLTYNATGGDVFTFTITVPEPASLSLLALGGLALLRRRQ